MMTLTARKVLIFVDKNSQQWTVQDADGTFWMVPAIEEAWAHRRPFTPTGETDLEPVPAHYRYMLGLPR